MVLGVFHNGEFSFPLARARMGPFLTLHNENLVEYLEIKIHESVVGPSKTMCPRISHSQASAHSDMNNSLKRPFKSSYQFTNPAASVPDKGTLSMSL